MVIFGAGGDLVSRKLFPAMYNLMKDDLLSERFQVIAVDRRDRGADAYRDYIDSSSRAFIGNDLSESLWQELLERIHYFNGDFL